MPEHEQRLEQARVDAVNAAMFLQNESAIDFTLDEVVAAARAPLEARIAELENELRGAKQRAHGVRLALGMALANAERNMTVEQEDSAAQRYSHGRATSLRFALDRLSDIDAALAPPSQEKKP